jgi:hypothetical protein
MRESYNKCYFKTFQMIEMSVNCPVGLMSRRSNVVSAKCLSVKGPVGQTSVGVCRPNVRAL